MYEYETKAERFRRLAETRTNAVIEKIRLLGNLSNRANYEYTDEEVELMFAAIDEALRNSRARFRMERPKRFRLP
ncbi:hypothetical protein [Tepidiforma sp.]|uniref:hypothetical protein n=1 Tax=Tepidiforma sp. TaxID=2682230 RepID=UPI002ADE955F|nr:hypothetical protein [Tepidiforma sp.]